jgi:hypothetical protein
MAVGIITATPVGTIAPLMPEMNVALCSPTLPTRMVFDSRGTPGLPMSMFRIAPIKVLARIKSQRDVVASGRIPCERKSTNGRVVDAGCVVAQKRTFPGGRVEPFPTHQTVYVCAGPLGLLPRLCKSAGSRLAKPCW